MRYIVLSVVLLFSMHSFSQSKPIQKSDFWDHVQFGGGINLNFSNQYTVLGLSPSALYNFTDQLASGVSISYLYVKNKNVTDPLNVYGTSLLLRYKPIDELQVSTEFEENFLKQGNVKQTIPALYFGLGYNVSDNIGVGVRYDVLYDTNKSIYPSAVTPFIRVYF